MATLTESSTFDSGIYQLETSDPVLGGPGGVANAQAQSLANRSKYLKDHVDALEDGSTVPPGIATESYVQDEINKLDFKRSVRVATTANITLSGSQSVDGVTTNTGDRVLVKNQTTGSQNGIYVASGTSWTRATDADENVDVTAGMVVVVAEGTAQADTIWKLSTNDDIVVGTTALVFVDITTGYAPLNSPSLTGTPTVPTATAGNNTTQAASTEFATRLKNGRASVSVAGGSDVTLTAAQYGLGIIDLSGIVTANLGLIFPAASGTWVIANNSTGAFNITAKTAAGTGVVVPQGYAIVVYGDGTNIYAASAAGQSFMNQQVITGQTGAAITIPGGYTVGALLLEKNGIWMTPGVDFTATNGSTVTLTVAAISSDEFLSIAFSAFEVANALPLAGGTLTGALTLAGNPSNALEAAPKQYVDSLWPVGMVAPFANHAAPSGWLKCNGSAVSRTTYAALFAALVKQSVVTINNVDFTWSNHGLKVNDPVVLGTTGSLPVAFTAGVTYYVASSGLTADSFQLSATPGAVRIGSTGTGTGTHTATNAPHGIGDGSTTFNVPELRGEFVRGWDDGRAVDVNRVFGSAQEATGIPDRVASTGFITMNNTDETSGSVDISSFTVTAETRPRITYKVRPRNVAMMYCIKT